MKINVARTMPRSDANGPGTRFVVWVQGCPLACPGCWNRDTWPFERRQLREVRDLAKEILATSGIEGVTFTGGEPFAQAAALAALAQILKANGLTVFIFTGYAPEELATGPQRALLASADGLVAGRYIAAQRSVDERWRSSANQTLHGIAASVAPLGDWACSEVVVAANGGLTWTGFPEAGLLGN